MIVKPTSIPVTIIGGYLGSGKTTLVNHLLRHANGARLTIMVNDFGDLAIDADLIESTQDNIISLSGGCVCCSYGDDLSLSLQTIKSLKPSPDHIIIEASGVALPGAIGRTLSLHRAYCLAGVVVVADACNITSYASEKYIGDTIERQLYDADLIVLNKLDLIPKNQSSQLKLWLAEKSHDAPVIEAINAKVDSAVFFSIDSTNNTENLDEDDIHDVSLFASLSVKPKLAMDAQALGAQLAHKQLALIRAKGFVLDKDNTIKTVQVVGRRWSVTKAPDGVQTGLVCIAKKEDLPTKAIQALFSQDAVVTL